jgi:hypothetical protein
MKKFMYVDFKNCLTEIKTADVQSSHKDGVLIVVIGSLTSSEGICIYCKFTQTFFLAPQESGSYFVLNDVSPQESGVYFVLNDVFRFITEINHVVIQEKKRQSEYKVGIKDRLEDLCIYCE